MVKNVPTAQITFKRVGQDLGAELALTAESRYCARIERLRGRMVL